MPHSRRNIALSVVAVLLLTIAAMAVTAHYRAPRTSDEVVAAEQRDDSGRSAIATDASATLLGADGIDDSLDGRSAHINSASEPQPLPSAGTPVAEAFDELYARAKRGDTAAACWLGQELQRCAWARQSANYANNMETMAAQRSQTPEHAVNMINAMETRAKQLGEGCDELLPAQLDKAFELRLRAASVKPSLRVAMTLDPSLDRRDFLNDLERWAEYKRVAVPWLEQAARQGDAPALIALARVYGDHRKYVQMNPPFRIRDDAKFVLYSDLMARYGIAFSAAQPDLDAARARLSIEAQAKVAQQVDAMVIPGIEPLDESGVGAALGRSINQAPDLAACEAP